MFKILLVGLLIYVVLGLIGFVVHGLFWLFIIAALLFVGHLVFLGYHRGRQHH
jgi:hypothetical protein